MKFIKLSFLTLATLFAGCTDEFAGGDITIEDPESLIVVPISAKVAGHAYERSWNGSLHALGSVKVTFTKGSVVKTLWTSALSPVGTSMSHYSIWLTPGQWDIKAEKSGYHTLHSGVSITGPNDGIHSYYHFNPILEKKTIIIPWNL